MALTKDQKIVANKFLNFLRNDNKEMVIEGFPGTGKSYMTKYLIELAMKSEDITELLVGDIFSSSMQIECAATTNKAATILQELSGREAGTIHSLLGLKVTQNFKDGTTGLRKTRDYTVIGETLIIIDEASYIDSLLLKIIRESTYKCKILYIGDPYQLTSIHESVCPVFTGIDYKGVLVGSKRFAENGPIAALGAQFRKTIDTGQFTTIIPNGKEILHVDGQEFQKLINEEFSKKDHKPNDAKVVAWSNQKVREYNNYIRSLYTTSKAYIVGERVITNKPILLDKNRFANSYSTESISTITKIEEGNEKGLDGYTITLNDEIQVFQPANMYALKELLKQYKNKDSWPTYFKLKNYFADLRAVHASTVYKAQGSTYKKIFIDLTNIGKCNQPSVVARMLHVAVTRASEQVILYGQLPDKYLGG